MIEKTEIRIARIFNTYGPRMNIDDGRVVSNFIAQAIRYCFWMFLLTVFVNSVTLTQFDRKEPTLFLHTAVMNPWLSSYQEHKRAAFVMFLTW